MINEPRQLNSLRLSRLFGGGLSPLPPAVEWFYNGSVKFEKPGTAPRIFSSISGAVQYFTENLPKPARVPGQFVTYAEGTHRNWVSYVYIGKTVEDSDYSNHENWVLSNEVRVDPYTNLEEAINSDRQYYEELLAQNGIEETIK